MNKKSIYYKIALEKMIRFSSLFLRILILTDSVLVVRIIFKDYGAKLNVENIYRTILVFGIVTIVLLVFNITVKKVYKVKYL